MVDYQYVYDDFNDNSYDATRWSNLWSSFPPSESGGVLTTVSTANANPRAAYSTKTFYDLRKGRLAYKLSRSGTTNADTYAYFGIRDSSGSAFHLFGRSSSATLQSAVNQAGVGTETIVDTTVGVGPSWVNGTWLGWSYDESTSTYRLSKSTNATSWTEMYRFAVTTPGAFNPKQVGVFLGCTCYGTVTNYALSWDDVSYFATDTGLKSKVRYGGATVSASIKVRVSGSWVRPITKVRSGGSWVRPN